MINFFARGQWARVARIVFVALIAALVAAPLMGALSNNLIALEALRHPLPLALNEAETPDAACPSAAAVNVTQAQSDCQNDRACYLEGTAELARGAWQDAQLKLGRNSDTLSAFCQGWAMWCSGAHAEAERRWLRYGDSTAPFFRERGAALLRASKPVPAASWLEVAAAVLPSNVKTLNLLGQAEWQSGKVSQAAQAFEQAIAMGEAGAEVYTGAALAEYTLRQFDAARAHIEAAIQREPSNWFYWQIYGNVQLSMGELPAAEKSFRQVITLNPTYGSAYASLAYVLIVEGHLDEARGIAQAAVRLTPDPKPKAQYLFTFANAAARAGDFQIAIDFLVQAQAFDSENIDIRAALVNVYARAGQCALAQNASDALTALARRQGKPAPPRAACVQK